MTKTDELTRLLANLEPVLAEPDYVFCSIVNAKYGYYAELRPVASYVEDEGLTLVLEKSIADKNKLEYDSIYGLISLSLESDLNDVGLTAQVSQALANYGISANIMAAFHHDHIFIPYKRSNEALKVLKGLQNTALADLEFLNKDSA